MGFCLTSGRPNQNTMGNSADDDNAVGADVAVEPRGFAGDEVRIGDVIGQAEIVPGTVHPP